MMLVWIVLIVSPLVGVTLLTQSWSKARRHGKHVQFRDPATGMMRAGSITRYKWGDTNVDVCADDDGQTYSVNAFTVRYGD